MNKNYNFKKLTPFKWFVLQNFPFIDEDFDAITNYQLFCKLGEEINKVIESQNLVGTQVEELTTAFNALQDYVNNYFENLDIQEEVNNKLDEMAESGELTEIITEYLNLRSLLTFNNIEEMKAANYLVEGSLCKTFGYNSNNDGGSAFYKVREITNVDVVDNITIIALADTNLIAEYVSLDNKIYIKQFGAVETENVDNALSFNKALEYAKNNDIQEIILNGTFFINSTVSVTNLQNVTIKNGTILVHETDEILSNSFNVLYFNNANGVILDNIKIIETNPVARTRALLVGGILFINSKNCSIVNCYMENTCNGIMIRDSRNCSILNNIINVTYQNNQFSQTAILSRASQDTIIKNNKIYGEYYDGTLSIFGGGTFGNIVDGNELHNIAVGNTQPIHLSQGITIDRGVRYTTITNNIIYDQYYGIDNKGDSRNTLISNNTLVGCKIAIADRVGEDASLSQTFNCSILNNKIIIQKDYETENLATYLHYGIYYYVGILCGVRLGMKIKNNDIFIFQNVDAPILGIDCTGNIISNIYNEVNLISGNNIEFATGIGATTGNAPANSTGIIIRNLNKGSITNNNFKVDNGSRHYNFIKAMDTNTNLLISNNNCQCTNITNHYFIELIENATLTNSNILNNKISNANNNINSISNLTDINSISPYRTKSYVPSNSWTDVFTIHSNGNRPVIVEIEALYDYSGIHYLKGTYQVSISATTVSFVALNESKALLDIQFISDSNNIAKCQMKANLNILYGGWFKVKEFLPTNGNVQYLAD